jgi:hypothetical protein
MSVPKVFVSYSHDSQNHKKWVLDLATRLRNSGVDAIIDQWELKPGDDIPHFMEAYLSTSDYVLMICTNRYVEKANSGKGGVGYEKMIVTSELISNIDSNKVIPLIRQTGTREVPIFLKSKLFIDFSLDEEFEFSFDELVRAIHHAPIFIKPEIGNNPFTPLKDAIPDKSGDAIKKLMKIVIDEYESGEKFTMRDSVREQTGISRIMTDYIIDQAVEQGLIELDESRDLILTRKGKFYAMENKMV